jgi:hypothetical protein
MHALFFDLDFDFFFRIHIAGKAQYSKFDGLLKSPQIVMPDLIRHPERADITGFRLPDRVRHRLSPG